MAKEKKVDATKKVEKTKEIEKSKKNSKEKENKKSLWVRFRIFCHGVKSEFLKVHWTSKKDLVKYSIATILFMLFTALFFYLIDILFALVQSLI